MSSHRDSGISFLCSTNGEEMRLRRLRCQHAKLLSCSLYLFIPDSIGHIHRFRSVWCNTKWGPVFETSLHCSWQEFVRVMPGSVPEDANTAAPRNSQILRLCFLVVNSRFCTYWQRSHKVSSPRACTPMHCQCTPCNISCNLYNFTLSSIGWSFWNHLK